MSTICASALLGSLVDLDVLDDKSGGIEAFGVGIGFGVAEETEKKFGGLDGPASLGDAKLLAYSVIACQRLLISRLSDNEMLQRVLLCQS
jgi:hypothetical protein